MITTEQALLALEDVNCHQEIELAVNDIQKYIDAGIDLDIDEINEGVEQAECRIDNRVLH